MRRDLRFLVVLDGEVGVVGITVIVADILRLCMQCH